MATGCFNCSNAAEASEAVLATVDDHGLLGELAHDRLSGLFASDEDQLAYFTTAMGFAELSGFWAERDSQRSRVAAAARGTPSAAPRPKPPP